MSIIKGTLKAAQGAEEATTLCKLTGTAPSQRL